MTYKEFRTEGKITSITALREVKGPNAAVDLDDPILDVPIWQRIGLPGPDLFRQDPDEPEQVYDMSKDVPLWERLGLASPDELSSGSMDL